VKLISDILLAVSNALLVPDLVAALALLTTALVELGLLGAALLARSRAAPAVARLLHDLGEPDRAARRAAMDAYLATDPLPRVLPFRLAALGPRAWLAAARGLCVEEAELRVERRTTRLTFCIRLGPLVGLVGTLIPLGPGLVALAQGDIATMAGHMTVAFTVTVVGLTTGALGFVVASLRRMIDGRDLAHLAFVAATLDELAKPKEEPAREQA
jgi:biopolymer transport protein ExbB/TolQ